MVDFSDMGFDHRIPHVFHGVVSARAYSLDIASKCVVGPATSACFAMGTGAVPVKRHLLVAKIRTCGGSIDSRMLSIRRCQ